MFEILTRRAARAAERRAADRREKLAARLGERVPAGVRVAIEDDRVVMEGRSLGRRFLADPALRWLGVEVRDG